MWRLIIELHPVLDRPDFGETRRISLEMPANSYIAFDDKLLTKHTHPNYVLYYKKSSKTLVFEDRQGQQYAEVLHTVEIHLPKAKRIVYGTVGSHQLLLDLKHDDRSKVNLECEYVAYIERPINEYNFAHGYLREGSENDRKPKQIVLGVPAKTPTEEIWKIKLYCVYTTFFNLGSTQIQPSFVYTAFCTDESVNANSS